jgi:hypothetical protein
VLAGVASLESPHDGIELMWFVNHPSLERFEAWLRTDAGQRATAALRELEAPDSVAVVANELVVRGADWLTSRWRMPTIQLKHMALARRASGVSRAELSARWQSRAGQLGGAGSAQATRIPDVARGHAYVQNHPIASEHDWLYDAINEVYFDDLAAVRARIAFFETHNVAAADGDLFDAPKFVAVTEHVIL